MRAVLYLFAVIVLVALTVLVWRAFGPDSGSAAGPRSVGPDDDPEFLRRIDPGTRRSPEGDSGDDPMPGAPGG